MKNARFTFSRRAASPDAAFFVARSQTEHRDMPARLKTAAPQSTAKTPAAKVDKPVVYIDGEAGTTGLEIRRRLNSMPRLEVASIAADKRKDDTARLAMMREADLVVLCLPDPAAIEAAALRETLGDAGPKVIDASTAHRVADGWVYGFAELTPDQPAAIRTARRVSNPGCYPTGAIALIRPLVDAGLIP